MIYLCETCHIALNRASCTVWVISTITVGCDIIDEWQKRIVEWIYIVRTISVDTIYELKIYTCFGCRRFSAHRWFSTISPVSPCDTEQSTYVTSTCCGPIASTNRLTYTSQTCLRHHLIAGWNALIQHIFVCYSVYR